MATNSDPAFGPAAMTDGYSISGSQAKSVALNPGGRRSGGKRFSVAGPVFAGSSARSAGSARASSARAAHNDRTAGVNCMTFDRIAVGGVVAGWPTFSSAIDSEELYHD